MKLLRPLTYFAIVLSILACKRDELILPEDGKKSGEISAARVETGVINGTIDPSSPVVLGPIPPKATPSAPSVYKMDENWPAQAVATLQSFYSPTTALWSASWNVSATALSALIDYIKLSGNNDYIHVVRDVFEKNKSKNFITPDFEGNASWAIVWLKAYDLIGDRRYLDTAKIIADDLDKSAWNASCGGGIISNAVNKNKLSVANGLYIQLMAMLHNRIPKDEKYQALAVKGWDWLDSSGIINNAKLLNNGLNEKCKNDGLNNWTHSQGIYIGAALALYQALGKKEYLDKGHETALAAMTSLSTQGVLKEANDKACGACLGDERYYKGIFVRNARDLQMLVKDPKLGGFLENNLNFLWNNARSSSDLLGFHWQGPFDSGDAARQASGVDLLNGAILTKNPVNLALNRVAQVSGSCTPSETAVAAVDGSAATKWCATLKAEGASLVVDLGAQKDVKLFKVLHAGAGGELLEFNTKNFEIATGDSASGPWKDVVVAMDNTSSASFHKVDLKTRYIRLHVTKAGTDGVARIYEFGAQ